MSSEGDEDLGTEETKSPPKNHNSRKRGPEEDLDDEDHEVKRRRESESWDDLKELMKAR